MYHWPCREHTVGYRNKSIHLRCCCTPVGHTYAVPLYTHLCLWNQTESVFWLNWYIYIYTTLNNFSMFGSFHCFGLLSCSFSPCKPQNQFKYDKYEPQYHKTNKTTCALSEVSDQPVHLRSLISLCYVLKKKLRIQPFFMWTAKTDQTGLMPRLMWVFAGHTVLLSSCSSYAVTFYLYHYTPDEAVWSGSTLFVIPPLFELSFLV